MRHAAILLPGIVLPAELAYSGLIEALGPTVEARAKELEIYAGEEPPPGYGLDAEIDSVLRAASEAGFDRFHLVGYSGGGAISAALVARERERVLSLALLEPAWLGNEGQSEGERAAWRETGRLRRLPPEQAMAAFVRLQLAPGVEPPTPRPGPSPAWMAKRPAGIAALTRAFESHRLERSALAAFERPVYFALGGLSNREYFGAMAERMRGVFPDYTLETFARRHHFDPPHRAEPERLAAALLAIWGRAAPIEP